jgi:hypothetical protein
LKIHLIHAQTGQLADPEARGVEKLQDRPIPSDERLGNLARPRRRRGQPRGRGCEQLKRLVHGQVRRRPDGQPRSAHQLRGVGAQDAPAAEKSKEGPERGELSRHAAPRQLLAVQPGQEASNG